MRGSFSENEPYHTAIKETRARGSMEGGKSRKYSILGGYSRRPSSNS